MSVWTLGGFEAAANVAEETHLPTAILLSEILAVVFGLPVLIGFTLAIPSVEIASHDPMPLLYIIGSYFPKYVVGRHCSSFPSPYLLAFWPTSPSLLGLFGRWPRWQGAGLAFPLQGERA